MSNIRSLDLVTKLILIVLVVVISFIVLFLVTSEFLVEETTTSGMGMMNHMFDNPDYTVAILLSVAVALIAGVLVTLWLKPAVTTKSTAQVASVNKKVDELEIIKRALSDDEKAVLDEIKRAGEITQDSLRFRLEWSKAKLSRILTNLDKLNIIQRERFGKTYKVFLTESQSDQ